MHFEVVTQIMLMCIKIWNPEVGWERGHGC